MSLITPLTAISLISLTNFNFSLINNAGHSLTCIIAVHIVANGQPL